ncbi:MAG: IMP dehydrogenase [Candidatus Heimdallarchaeaceae archaeon]
MREGLTFDDVLLVPKRSSVRSRREIDTSTKLSRHIKLNIPIVSANMDTVTEHAMAIVMAQQGGIGIIHRFMTIRDQVNEVNKVKRSEMIRIDAPYCLLPNLKLRDAKNFMQEKGISGILIKDENDILIGILTSRDIKFAEDDDIPIQELMSTDIITARPDITIEEAKEILMKNRIEKLPLVDEQGKIKGLITATDIIKAKDVPKASKDAKGRLQVGAAIGVVGDYLERAEALINSDVDVLVLDIAHGHSDLAINAIKAIRKEFGDVELIAGNVATAEGTLDLIEAGSDGIKVGVGPGSICFEEDALVTMGDYSVKKIKDISPGDYVITHKNKKRMVTKKYTRKYTGEIIEINVKGSPGIIKVTPEHPFYAITFDADEEKIKKYGAKYYFSKKKYNKGLKWVSASDLKRGDIVVIPRTVARKTSKKKFDLTDYVECHFDNSKIWSNKVGFNPNEESYNDLAERFSTTKRVIGNIVQGGRSVDMQLNKEVNQYLETVHYQREITPNKINRFVELDKNLMKLFGYFVAEGYVCGNKNNRSLRFAFSKDETSFHEEVTRLIEEVFDYTNCKILFHKTRNSAVVAIHSHFIASFFERLFPLGAKNKKIPEFVLEQEKSLLIEFVRGAFNGDGSIADKRRASYKTISPSLAFQMSEILIRLGFLPTLTVENIKTKKWSNCYRINISGKQYDRFMEMIYPNKNFVRVNSQIQQIWADEEYIYLPVMSVKSKNKQTVVYNLEVDDDNTYLVNRIAVHNCITRIVAGAGVPQLTAIMEAAKIAREYDVPLIADGGIRTSGDIAKAIAAGAQTVMIGNLLAGTEESPGAAILRQGRRYKVVRGMASLGATLGREAKEKKGSFDDLDLGSVVPEGVEAMVPYRGSAVDVLTQLVGGFRSGVSYCGASNIKEMQEKVEFIKITAAGRRESSSHDVELI